ncbi:12600_t:CDS:1 [Rhizophagus irregularis]|nr:12600_t:CDS:1 [Rhizophagus irregularis]
MEEINLDCLVLIFNILKYDKKSLYFCLLVNKKWCDIVVPILWKKYCPHEINEKLCNVILSFLPSSSKKLLSDNNIKLPSTLLKFPLFNYISFCRYISSNNMSKIIDIVLKNLCNDHRRNLMEQEIYKLFISQCKNIEYLCWTTHQPLTLFPRASIFFSQLYELYIDIDSVNSDALYELAQICKDLNTLSINSFCSIPDIFYLIDAQRNLKKLNIYTEIDEKTGKELSKALARNRTIINDLHLNSIYNIVLSSLTTLVNLKKLTIFHWENYEKIQQYLAIYEFPNLQELTLIDGHLLSFKEISLLIEKTIGNITRIIITTNKTAKEAGILIKAISDNCPKINDLRTYIEPKDFIHIKSLLLNCRSLNAISLNSLEFFINENDNNIGDELLFHFLQNL